ncbi:MAG TPA: Smr/MutS family protein [Candidatus Acidoferrales bacterium]|jgi:DNA mismatch repair protein MutS2|nr:Smr/MutS family protein [Candidatus Acidoferrales bacterium]
MALADSRTLEALDFAGVRERVVAATRTARGRAFALELMPLDEFGLVRHEQRRTEAVRSLMAGFDLRIMPAIETASLTEAAQVGRTLSGSDLHSIGEAVAAAGAAHRAVGEHPDLSDVVAGYTPLRELQRAIGNAVDERGAVLDRASPALGRIRRSLAQAQADARDRVTSILNSAKHAKTVQDRIVTVRNGRFVIPIKAEMAGALPSIVHDTSASGQTLFVEPLAALETNNRVRTLQIEEEREIQRILEALSHEVGRYALAIDANVEILARIDVLAAKAELALRSESVAPELSEEPEIAVERGRHPLLGDRAVPQSLAVDGGTRLLVISGPNMGGKTVALKMAGLFVVMTYCGMQLPAGSGTRIGRFERLVADIGDEQSLVANASTFSAHLDRMREMLEGANARTLAIVDEIGGGTEPSAGAALAIAILERLLVCGARAIVSTHALELKLFAHATASVANASVRFDPKTFAPTFELDVGTPGQSLAFPLATRLGIDPQIVERAAALLERRELDYEAALAELALRSSELRESREGVERERAAASRQLESLHRERNELDEERRRFSMRAEERLAQTLRDFVREQQQRRPSRSQAASLAQTLETMRLELGIRRDDETAESADAYSAGDRVRVLSLNQEGVVTEDWDERLLVSIGSMKVMVEKSDVRRDRRVVKGERAQPLRGDTRLGQTRLEAAARASASLDVRGKRFAEAEPIVERWIDDALLAGTSPLRLVHGKGTGMLGRGLQEHLRDHPAVKSLRYGNEEEGSTGVTLIELRT